MICVFILMSAGLLLLTSTGHASSKRIGVDDFYFFNKQIIFIILSIILMFVFIFIKQRWIVFISFICMFIIFIILIYLLILGTPIHGSKRWINLFGISIQPTEFLKPFYFVITAFILSSERHYNKDKLIILLHSLLMGLIILQPDFGTVLNLSCVFGAQFFCSNMPFYTLLIYILCCLCILPISYFFLPHVQKRIDAFLYPTDGLYGINYQGNKSIECYLNGGYLGVGPGEGVIKYQLPDSHTDYIFAVMGEEIGAIIAAFLIVIYALLVSRGFFFAYLLNNKFLSLTIIGIMTNISFQSIINISVTLGILPSKGMTLPFISYGGSSILSLGISIGIYLNYTKKIYKEQKQEYESNIKY